MKDPLKTDEMEQRIQTLVEVVREEQVKEHMRQREYKRNYQNLKDYAMEAIAPTVEVSRNSKTGKIELFFSDFKVNGKDWYSFSDPADAMEWLAENAPKRQF